MAPAVSGLTEGYWRAAQHQQLAIQRCGACRRFVHFPEWRCPFCRRRELEFEQVSGRGRVHTFTIVHRPTLPVFEERVPYNVVAVQLDEGVYMVSNLVECALEDIRIGMPVEVVFEPLTDEIALPKFRLGGAG